MDGNHTGANPEENGHVCTECGGSRLYFDTESGEEVCMSCGMVQPDVFLRRGPEYRIFIGEEDWDKRIRAEPGDTATTFDVRSGSPEKRADWLRIRKKQTVENISEGQDRNLMHAQSELDKISNTLGIADSHIRPNIINEETWELYVQCYKKDLIRGRRIVDFVAASYFATCRIYDEKAISLEEIAEAAGVNVSDVFRCYGLMNRELGIRRKAPKPEFYVPRIANTVGASLSAEELAIRAIRKLRERKGDEGTAGKYPISVASGALYAASQVYGQKIAQKKIAKAAGVSQVSLRNRVKDFDGMDLSELAEGIRKTEMRTPREDSGLLSGRRKGSRESGGAKERHQSGYDEILRLVKTLELIPAMEEDAKSLYKEFMGKSSTGINPKRAAAACVALASDTSAKYDQLLFEQVAEKSPYTDGQISDIYMLVTEELGMQPPVIRPRRFSRMSVDEMLASMS